MGEPQQQPTTLVIDWSVPPHRTFVDDDGREIAVYLVGGGAEVWVPGKKRVPAAKLQQHTSRVVAASPSIVVNQRRTLVYDGGRRVATATPAAAAASRPG